MRCLPLQPFALMKLRPLRIKYASLTPVFFLITIDPFGSSRDIDHIYTRASTHVEAKWATRNTHTHMLHGRGSIWKPNSLCGQNPWMIVWICFSVRRSIIVLSFYTYFMWRDDVAVFLTPQMSDCSSSQSTDQSISFVDMSVCVSMSYLSSRIFKPPIFQILKCPQCTSDRTYQNAKKRKSRLAFLRVVSLLANRASYLSKPTKQTKN